MIFDTDVIIWALRGNKTACSLLDVTKELSISIITYMELLKGAPGKHHASEIHRIINKYEFNVLPINENIGHRAFIYISEYGSASGMGVPDALIAATAAENGIHLCTGNYKDFKEIQGLEIKVFKVL